VQYSSPVGVHRLRLVGYPLCLFLTAANPESGTLTYTYDVDGNVTTIISAGGIKRAFPAVASLVDAVPPLDRWQVTAFRPRRTPSSVVEFRGKRVDPGDVQFSLLDNGKIAGIYLFIPSFREDDADLKQIGYLLLDETLGEYDVESRLGLVKMLPPDTRTEAERHPQVELPILFDRLVSRLEGPSGIPLIAGAVSICRRSLPSSGWTLRTGWPPSFPPEMSS
jgi:YD repeat-containing protein